MKKNPLKSKTIQGLLVAAIIVIMSILGVGEEQIGETIDTISDTTGQQTEAAKNIGLLGTILYSIYGRSVAKGPLIGKDEGND